MASPNAVTQLLQDWSNGSQAALDKLIPVVQAELHRLAQRYLRRERRGHTLQTSALVNEAFLQLIDQHVSWQNRAHFFGVAAQLMRRIEEVHAPIKHHLRTDAGLRMQFIDSEIAERVMLKLMARNSVCLPIHDSFIGLLSCFGVLHVAPPSRDETKPAVRSQVLTLQLLTG